MSASLLPTGGKSMSAIGLAVPAEFGQRDDLHLLHLSDDARKSLLILGMGHDPKNRGNEVAGGFEGPVDALDRFTVVALGAFGIEEHLFWLLEVAEPRRHWHVHVVIVAGDHQRDVIRIEGRHLQDHGILAQVE